jgi:hypothetical protein
MASNLRLGQVFDVYNQFVPTKASVYLKRMGLNLSNYFLLSSELGERTSIDATNFYNITQGDYKYILNDNYLGYTGNGFLDIYASTGANIYPIVNYPVKTDIPHIFYLWIRGQARNGIFNANILLDDIVIKTIRETLLIADNTWRWFDTSFVLPDTEEHRLGIQVLNRENTLDKLCLSGTNTSVDIPTDEGFRLTTSPFFTIHMQVYRVDENYNVLNKFDVYDYKNSIDEIIQDDWYNFNIKELSSLSPSDSSLDYSERAAIVLSSSGAYAENFVLWELVDNDEYRNEPSLIRI